MRATRANANTNLAKYKSKYWCFTYFPQEEETIYKFKEEKLLKRGIKYAIVGEEYAPSTGRRHFQGYIEFITRKRLNEVKNFLESNEIHIEPSKGTRNQNYDYCTKPNESNFPEKVFIEVGDGREIKEMRRRIRSSREGPTAEDIRNNKMMLFLNDLETKSLEYIRLKYPVQYYKEFNLILKYRQEREQGSRVWNGELKSKNYWIWGKTGVGKSTWARKQLHKNESDVNLAIFYKPINKWWDGYVDQNIVLVEDWNPGENGSLSKALVQYIKVWADRFSFNAEVKGGTRCVFPGRYFLIITSNHSIDEAFDGISIEDVDAIKRRFNEVEIKDRNDIFLNTQLDPTILSDPVYSEVEEEED